MSEKTTYIKTLKIKSRKVTPDHGLSKNHSKDVKYRLRVQRDKEAAQEIKHYDDDQNRVS